MINAFVLPNMITLGIIFIIFCLGAFWTVVYINYRKRIRRKSPLSGFMPNISVLIPAFNEEKNIASVLSSVLSSNYPKNKMEIIVVDDGSKDRTAEIAKVFPVKVLSLKKNMGKIFALNQGIHTASNEVLLTLDADIEIEPSAIKRMVQYFKDPAVGAVSGIYKSKKIHDFASRPLKYILEKAQALEYLGFALSRKQQEVMESILVVPGSIAAYRKSVLLEVGKFDSDTIIEDYDMTIKIHKAGYKVRCDKDAVGWVVAPQTLKSLIRERYRWYRGGLQVIKKHFDMFKFTKIGAITALWALEIFSMTLQLLMAGIVYYRFTYLLTNYTINQLIEMALTPPTLALIDPYFITTLGLTVALIVMGLFTTYISIKMNNDSKRKMFLYPIMVIYNTILFFIWIKALVQEAAKTKCVWIKAEN